MRVDRAPFAVGALLVIGGCGGSTSPTRTPAPSVAATAAPTPELTAVPPTPTPANARDPLAVVAAATFPPCPNPVCVGHGTNYTTCDSGLTGATPIAGSPFGLCPFTQRLQQQLTKDIQGGDAGGGPADALGGGQDPEWPTETITVTATGTGGVAEVTFVDGANTSKTDLVIVSFGGTLLVDDIYCAGTNPSTTDAYAAGWGLRAACNA
jgi:hypothetical protein